jgi:hypothetical protein
MASGEPLIGTLLAPVLDRRGSFHHRREVRMSEREKPSQTTDPDTAARAESTSDGRVPPDCGVMEFTVPSAETGRRAKGARPSQPRPAPDVRGDQPVHRSPGA